MNTKIWLSSPHMGGAEQKYIQEAFENNWIAPLGPNVQGFEKDLEDYLETGYVCALSSGTAALHLALILLGVSSDDEVICQSLTFSASANPIVYQGAAPIFIDSEVDTWNMCPQSLEDAIKDRIARGKKPKAIIPVHLYGMPAKMEEISKIAQHYEVPIIEDAAEALGSQINGQMCGTFGGISILSFNGNKIITTSGGGALVAREKSKTDKALFLATQARDEAPHYQHSHIGYNYRMSNVVAGIGRGQMEVLPLRIEQRRAVYEKYNAVLSKIDGVSFVKEPDSYFSNRWLSTVLINPQITGGITREDVRIRLASENIEARPLWKPMHLQPVFKDAPYYGGDLSESLFNDGLCLPSGSNLTEADIERVMNEFQKAMNS